MSDQSTPGAAPAPTPPPAQTFNIQAPPVAPSNGLAVASLVLGIIALVFFWLPLLGWIPVILSIVMGLIALQQPYGRGMAMAGLICGGIALVIKMLFWVMLLGIFGAAASVGHLHGY
jgi:hypothetical protein